MTIQSTTIYTPFADGRTVRDIVEHSPALVNEAWCRDLLRHTLDSLERQYATSAPHRPVSPDTIVMLDNNEALLLPAPEEVGPAGAAMLAADLHALALVVHYAITAELPPEGPLGPRLYDNYSAVLTNGLDRCLGPNGRLRPKTIDDMRAMLGLEAARGDEPVHASTLPAEPAAASGQATEQPSVEASAPAPEAPALAARALPEVRDTMDRGAAPVEPVGLPAGFRAPPDDAAPAPTVSAAPAPQDAAPVPVPDFGQPVPRPVVHEMRPAAAAMATPLPATSAREQSPELEPAPLLHTPSSAEELPGAAPVQASVPEKRAAAPAPGTEAPLLHTQAAANTDAWAAAVAAAAAEQPAAPGAATPVRAREGLAAGHAGTVTPARGAPSRVQRWGWIAGAAIVLLAAGSALVSFFQQSDSREMVALSLPPAERAANGLDAGETVVAPRTELGNPPAGAEPAAGALTGQAGMDPAGDAPLAALPGAVAGSAPAATAGAPGRGSESVVNGITYKLLIKPWGTVYVDGVDRGVSPPVKRLTLGPGRHTVRIVNPNFPERVFTIDAGTRGSTMIEHDFTANAE